MKDSDMKTVVKDLEEYHIVRAACWFHARHYQNRKLITSIAV